MIKYKKNDDGWQYTLTEDYSFKLEHIDFGDEHHAYSATTGQLLMSFAANTITIRAGYSWDGCSVIGRLLETDATRRAALLHDGLYQRGRNGGLPEPTYSRYDADVEFRRVLPLWAKAPYFLAVVGLGWIVYGKEKRTLIIK